MDVTKLIKLGCIKENISLCDLAEKIGTTKQNLSNKMKRNDFKTSDIDKIFAALNLTLKVYGPDGKEL